MNERPDENNGALAVEFTPEDLRQINIAISQISVQGGRYPKELAKQTGR